MAIKREIRREAMQDPFGGDPALEALAKDYFEKRKHERMRKGLARAGQFPMAVAGIPAAQREILAPIKPVRVSYEDAATFNRGIHDRLKDLEQYLASPGASAKEANKKLHDLYKTILGEASNNARTNASNVTSIHLDQPGRLIEVNKLLEERLKGEASGYEPATPAEKAQVWNKLEEALVKDPLEIETELAQALNVFGAKHPEELDDLIRLLAKESPVYKDGSPIDLGKLQEEVHNTLSNLDDIGKNPESANLIKVAAGIDSWAEEIAKADAEKFTEFLNRNDDLKNFVRNMRAGGTAVGSEAAKLFEVLDMLDERYGGLQKPEDILELEKTTRPKTRAMYDKVAESLVTPSAPTAFEESERALVGSPGFKEFMEKHGLTKNQAVKLLTRQARRGKVATPGAEAAPTGPVTPVSAVPEAAEEEPSPGAALAAPAGGERSKKPIQKGLQEGLGREEAMEEQTSWFDEQGGELGKFGLTLVDSKDIEDPEELPPKVDLEQQRKQAELEEAARYLEMNPYPTLKDALLAGAGFVSGGSAFVPAPAREQAKMTVMAHLAQLAADQRRTGYAAEDLATSQAAAKVTPSLAAEDLKRLVTEGSSSPQERPTLKEDLSEAKRGLYRWADEWVNPPR